MLEQVITKPVYEWKNPWMHKEWELMPGVHTDAQANQFLQDRLPLSEDSSIRINGKTVRPWDIGWEKDTVPL